MFPVYTGDTDDSVENRFIHRGKTAIQEALTMFVGRKEELKALEDGYSKNEFTFIPIYGRKRIGKTQLIEKFIHSKRAVFFTAVSRGTYRANLELLSKAIFGGNELARSMAVFKPLWTACMSWQKRKAHLCY